MNNDTLKSPVSGNAVVERVKLPTNCGLALLLALLFCLCVPSAILFLVAAGRNDAIYDNYNAGNMKKVQNEIKLVKMLIGMGLVIVALSVVFICVYANH